MLVEFVGAAGVGKTFLSTAVASELARRDIPAGLFRTVPVTSSRVRQARAWLRAAWAVALSRPRTLSAFRAHSNCIARHQLRWEDARERPQVLLCDEGFFHRLRAFYRSSNGMEMRDIADRVAGRMAVGDVLVVVQATAETIQARRILRNKDGDKMDIDSVRADVRLMEESIATAFHVQRSSHPDLRVLMVDSEADHRAIVEQIVSVAAAEYRTPRIRSGDVGRLEPGKVSS